MQRPVPTQLTTKERKRRALEETIASVAKLFPATFAAERQRPHKPLKLGIRPDIIERGVLMPTECCRALARYCTRRAYQVALATGGARFELDGTPSGEATAAEQQAARDAIARIDALRNERAAAAKATFKAEANSEATPAAKPNLKLVSAPDRAETKRRVWPPILSRHHGLKPVHTRSCPDVWNESTSDVVGYVWCFA